MLFSRLATRGRRASVLAVTAAVCAPLLLLGQGSAWAETTRVQTESASCSGGTQNSEGGYTFRYVPNGQTIVCTFTLASSGSFELGLLANGATQADVKVDNVSVGTMNNNATYLTPFTFAVPGTYAAGEHTVSFTSQQNYPIWDWTDVTTGDPEPSPSPSPSPSSSPSPPPSSGSSPWVVDSFSGSGTLSWALDFETNPWASAPPSSSHPAWFRAFLRCGSAAAPYLEYGSSYMTADGPTLNAANIGYPGCEGGTYGIKFYSSASVLLVHVENNVDYSPATLGGADPCADGQLEDDLNSWGGYGGGGAWGASAPDGKTLWEHISQPLEELRNPVLLWRNLQDENPELVGAWESYEGWFWAQYDTVTEGWVLLDRNGAAVDKTAVGFGGYGGGGEWGVTCEPDPAAAPEDPPSYVVVPVAEPPAEQVTGGGGTAPTSPPAGCDFGLLDPSSWLCGLGSVLGKLLDVFRAVLRAVLALAGQVLELLKDLFIPGPGTFDKLGELKTAFTTHPPGSILVGGGQFVGGLATGLEGAGCAAGPDFSPEGYEGLMQLPGQCNGTGYGMMDLLYGFVTVCLYASLMWSLWYLAESHFGVGMEA